MQTRSLAVALGTAVLLTACGSTVAGPGGTGGAAVATGDGLSSVPGTPLAPDGSALTPGVQGGATAAGVGTDAGGGVGSGAGGPAVLGGTAGTPAAPAGSGAGISRPVAAGASGPGITSDKIFVGVEDNSANDKRLEDAGIKGAATGSDEQRHRLLIEDINKRGGVGGRKLVPLVYRYDSGTADQAGERQRECTYFTQDNKIFAFMGGTPFDDYRQCMNKAGVSVINDLFNIDAKTLQQFPYTHPFGALRVDRQLDVYIDGLVAQGFFKGGKRIGLLTSDAPVYVRNTPLLERALARHGLKVGSRYQVSIASNQDLTRDAQAAVLKFASDGVDRVIFNANQPGILGFFQVNASSQRYYPRYGVSSGERPALIRQNVPDDRQFEGMMGVGWTPYDFDVTTPPPYTAAGKQCLDRFAAGGLPAGGQAEAFEQLNTCDMYDFLTKALAASGPQITPDTFRSGARAAGQQLVARGTFRLDTSRHPDGVAAVRHFAWDGQRFVYTSGDKAVR